MRTIKAIARGLVSSSDGRRRFIYFAAFLALGLMGVEMKAAGPSAFSFAASLLAGRTGHTATLLSSGQVLIAGGADEVGNPLTKAELYDPATRTWSEAGNATEAFETATLLQNGKVLFVGGTTAAAELYDPATGTWNATGSASVARTRATATLLANGKVLFVGGLSPGTINALKTAELYNPAAGTWSSAGSLANARLNQTATLLINGKVLVAGGVNGTVVLQSCELYDPTGGTWSSTGSLKTARTADAAVLLTSGKVLIEGGTSASAGVFFSSAELYDPSSGSWSSTGSLAAGRSFHAATLLQDGKVLVTGGFTTASTPPPANAEIYDPGAGTWSAAGSLGIARYSHTATLLPNNKVLLAGGSTSEGGLSASELYDPTATAAPSRLQNISTRANVQTGEDVMIGGFIITGSGSKQLLFRAIGPSLETPGELVDPTIELHMPDGSVITNDNWKIDDSSGQSQQAVIEATTIPPSNDLESALVETLAPGNYTVIVKGKNSSTGLGLVEVYDLDQNPAAVLANISTRGFVGVGNNVMIGGVILGPGTLGYGEVVVRALGPTLAVNSPLANPALELHNGNGDKVDSNNDWSVSDTTGETQVDEILSTLIAPQNSAESALLTTLLPGNYTVIVSGTGGTTGVGLVEVYNLRQ